VSVPATTMLKFKTNAMAWDASPRAIFEAFFAQLPEVMPPTVAAPDPVAWATPKD
jgi:hypothetical protein